MSHATERLRPALRRPGFASPVWSFIQRQAEARIARLLAQYGADIEIDGPRPWDPQVKDRRLFLRLLLDGDMGLGESYAEAWWECRELDTFFFELLRSRLGEPAAWKQSLIFLQSRLMNMQDRVRSKVVARKHYDLPAEFFMAFLDRYNQYTCGYFKDVEDLERAQVQKLDLICRKLHLRPDDVVLDIGCGWGGFARYAAEHYGCKVVGVTISEQQHAYASSYCEGLPVEIKLCDYRDLTGSYTKILVCGMIEHVGSRNYHRLMKTAHRCLRDDGLFLLQTIGDTNATPIGGRWHRKYIFPNSDIPTADQLVDAIRRRFLIEDWHNFGAYYDNTLLAWHRNLRNNWHTVAATYGEYEFRKWEYYFLSCAGAFRARMLQLWQLVLSKAGVPGGYASVR